MPRSWRAGAAAAGNPNWNAAADLTWLRGKHNFKGGFQMLRISRLQKNQFGQTDVQRGGHAQSAVDDREHRRSDRVGAARAA